MTAPRPDPVEGWPPLPLDGWRPTYETLHRWLQIAGKVRLALAPPLNHWWHVPLYVTPRGLTTGAIPHRERSFELAFDLLDHALVASTSDGRREVLPLGPRSVAAFYGEVMALLRGLGIEVSIWTTPVELPAEAIPFEHDELHAAYDAPWATRCLRVLQGAKRVLDAFASRFQGKQSPVHLFWGSFDLAGTRFSGRRAPPRPGADRVTVEAYSHEVASFGFWPGTPGVSDAAFYAYGAPEPEGFKDEPVAAPGRYHRGLGERVLPYEEARRARDPGALVLAFYQDAYDAIARLGRWDRAALDRAPGPANSAAAPGAAGHQPEQPAP